MNNNLRLIFIYCNDDPWIGPISEDIYKASRDLGHELFVIGAGKNYFVDKEIYINLDFLKYNFCLSNVFESLKDKNVDFVELVNREYKFLAHQSGKIDKTEIQKRLSLWFVEATLILKIVQPDILIVWNGLLSKRAVYAEAAKFLCIPVYYAEKGMLPDSWYIDTTGVNALSTVAEKGNDFEVSKGKIESWMLKLNMINEKGESAWRQPDRINISVVRKNLGIKRNQRIIFFPGQVDSDSNIILFSPYFKTVLNALEWLVKGLPEADFFILAKPHPKGKLTLSDFEKVIADKGKAVLDINIIDAIELADCIVSINSTVAFEAAIRGKPVLLLGRGVLSDKDFVSSYVPGIESYIQVKECIDRYNKTNEYLFHKAISFAVYLDSEYYTYRKNYPKTLRLLESMTKNHNIKEKTFSVEESAAFFQEIYYKDVKNSFPCKVLVKALFEKIKDRFRL